MSRYYSFIIIFFNVLNEVIFVKSIKMNQLPFKLNERITIKHLQILHLYSLNYKQHKIYTYIKRPLLHINQRKLSYLKSNKNIYSKYYNNEPIYSTYNPILNYDVLDLIKVYGRLAEHSNYESLNIIINVNGEKKKKYSDLFKNFFFFFKNNDHNNYNKVLWFDHFSKYGKMNFTDFKNSLLKLRFKWPKDSLFPTYNIFLFEKGLSKNMDSPLIRKKVEKYIQHQEINEDVLKSCFYCFSSGKEYITADDILNTFNEWKENDKKKKKDDKKKSFSFFKKYNNTNDSIDWFTFKNNIDLCTIKLHESKK
ncbi:conserved Plasmodium protein, unknown function [Plasmodium gallinaceum]|uniref:Uncharacterized protein n=1 Tax=Plasmodium gallinaceum TaxID=5849 RepID=A0A1J1GTZ5_PLAGA|nr:conserved Plasmodium protein, unknown function [Plasmodium gallinaceum]CRG95954.1 conserved Plasmodium protein, unknown function [Plasmodium gallinaceum]